MKFKLLTRFCAATLCLVMVLTSVISCSSKELQEDAKTNNNGDSSAYEDSLPERNMEQFELKFLNYTDEAHGFSLKTICTEDVSEAINKAIYMRNIEVEERFNTIITERQTANMIDDITKSVLSGDGTFHVAMIFDEKVNGANVAGLLGSWNDMTYCDFSKDWWNSDAGNCFSLNGRQYGAVGDFSLSMHSKNYCYFFNKSMYSTITGAEDLYGLVRDGKWTIEKMLQIGEEYTADLDGDGLWYDGTDQYGIAGTTKVNYQLIFSGAGMKYVDQDNNGTPYFALNTANSIEKLSNIISMFSDTHSYYNNNPSAPHGGINSEDFLNSKVLIFASTVWNMTDYSNYKIDYGVLPAPKYNEEQSNYYSVAVGGQVACLSRTIPEGELENVSILIEAMCSHSYSSVVPTYKETILKARYSNAPEDAEMLQLIFDSTIFDLGTSVWNIDIRRPIMDNLFNELDSGVASYIKSLTSSAEGAISKSIGIQ